MALALGGRCSAAPRPIRRRIAARIPEVTGPSRPIIRRQTASKVAPGQRCAAAIDLHDDSFAPADAAAPAADAAPAPEGAHWQQLIKRWLYATAASLALGLALCQGRAQAASQTPPTAHAPVAACCVERSAAVTAAAGPGAAGTQEQGGTLVTSGPWASIAASALRQPDLLQSGAGLQCRLHEVAAAGPAAARIALLLAATAPVVLAGALLLRKTAGSSWPDALRRSFSLVGGTPGATAAEADKGWATALVLHALFWAGLLTFAVLVGIVADDVSRQAREARSGSYPVAESAHTVVLNWNAQALPLLQQLIAARADTGAQAVRGPFVVLADRSKQDMDLQVASGLPQASHVKVLTRAGNPTKPQDLHRAAAGAASAVVVLWPEDIADPAKASAHQAAVLAALKAVRGGTKQQQVVVVQKAGEPGADLDALRHAVPPGGRQLPQQLEVAQLQAAGPSRLHQLLGMVASQPGLEDALADLLEFEEAGQLGAEFYMGPAPCCLEHCPQALHGKPYGTVRRSYPHATVVGFQAPGKQALLNPPDVMVVPPGSQLVFIAGSSAESASAIAAKQPYQVDVRELPGDKGSGRRRQAPRSITALCFDAASAAGAVKGIASSCPRGSHIRVVCGPGGPDAKALQAPRVRVTAVAGHPSSTAALSSGAAGLDRADAVVLCGLDGRDPAAADAQVVSTVLQLQALAAKQQRRNTPLAVVAAVNAAETEEVLWHAVLSHHAELKADAAARAAAIMARHGPRAKGGSGDTGGGAAAATAAAAAAASLVTPAVSLHLLRPSSLQAGMLTQVACAPRLAAVFEQLFVARGGQELQLREPASAYGLALGAPTAWRDVAELARRKQETAIGVVREATSRVAQDSGKGAGGAGSGSSGSAAAEGAVRAASLEASYYWPGVQLGLHADEELVLGPRDKLVVIAKHG